jgi:hypothetical protein
MKSTTNLRLSTQNHLLFKINIYDSSSASRLYYHQKSCVVNQDPLIFPRLIIDIISGVAQSIYELSFFRKVNNDPLRLWHYALRHAALTCHAALWRLWHSVPRYAMA